MKQQWCWIFENMSIFVERPKRRKHTKTDRNGTRRLPESPGNKRT